MLDSYPASVFSEWYKICISVSVWNGSDWQGVSCVLILTKYVFCSKRKVVGKVSGPCTKIDVPENHTKIQRRYRYGTEMLSRPWSATAVCYLPERSRITRCGPLGCERYVGLREVRESIVRSYLMYKNPITSFAWHLYIEWCTRLILVKLDIILIQFR